MPKLQPTQNHPLMVDVTKEDVCNAEKIYGGVAVWQEELEEVKLEHKVEATPREGCFDSLVRKCLTCFSCKARKHDLEIQANSGIAGTYTHNLEHRMKQAEATDTPASEGSASDEVSTSEDSVTYIESVDFDELFVKYLNSSSSCEELPTDEVAVVVHEIPRFPGNEEYGEEPAQKVEDVVGDTGDGGDGN